MIFDFQFHWWVHWLTHSKWVGLDVQPNFNLRDQYQLEYTPGQEFPKSELKLLPHFAKRQ